MSEMLCILNRQEDMKLEITLKNGTREYEVARTPTEGKLFIVDPLRIDRKKFKESRFDPSDVNGKWENQERARYQILEAFEEVDKHPGKYDSPFYTLIPEKKWDGGKSVVELEEYAKELGGTVAYWVEQALEWAQRIHNGESWEEVCNNVDTANWYRMIIWKDGRARGVGGRRDGCVLVPASYVLVDNYDSYLIYLTVPLVVIRNQ